MKDTFIFLQKGSWGLWLDPKNTTVAHIGRLNTLPPGADLIAIATTEEGAKLAIEYHTAVNPNVRFATA